MAQRTRSAGGVLRRTGRSSSSDSDDEFEKFLSRMKTPKSASCCTPRAKKNSSAESKENLFWHLTSKGVLSDSDDDCVFGKHPPRSPCQPIQAGHQKWNQRGTLAASSQEKPTTPKDGPASPRSVGGEDSTKERAQGKARQPGPSACGSSDEEEIDRLSVRVKQGMVLPASTRAEGQAGSSEQRGFRSSCGRIPAAAAKSENGSLGRFGSPAPVLRPVGQVPADVLQAPWTPVRSACQVQGCFLQELSDPTSRQAREFRTKKEEMAQSLYAFYNRTIFEQKLPERMEISWSKKMRKTAGCCITGQLKDPHLGQRHARIMLSEKVCDSADRLRDTLIHELCHAAAWLIHGVRDGHGRFWSLYAKKSALIHPELPVVSRCHNYEIKYKFTYECSQCQNRIGRHSKSLDTQRFVCALCKGKLVLQQPMRKDGTPAKPSLTPFAKYVKENYASAKQSQQGLSHGAIMRKLSADFASRP